MDFLSKYVKKSTKSERESELEIQLENLQEKYNVLKESHEYTVKMLEESKKTDNSVLQAYNRLKAQFQELTHYVSIKKSLDLENIIKQQAELSKHRDLLDSREKTLNEREKRINTKEHIINLIETGKSVEDLVEENQSQTEQIKKLTIDLNTIKNNNNQSKNKLKSLLGTINQRLENLKKNFLDLENSKNSLKDFDSQLKIAQTQILESLSKKPESKPEEAKKIEKPENKKNVIPMSFKKKPSAPLKISEIDLEKELGNPFNS